MSDRVELNALAVEQREAFAKCLPLQLTLQELTRSLGRVREQQTCLEIGARNGMFSRHLRRVGGTWRTVAADDEAATAVGALLNETVPAMVGGKIPLDNKVFDIAVAVNVLERCDDDVALIEECHRVLKPDGRLLLVVSREKGLSLIHAVRKLTGVTAASRGNVRPGYDETALFSVLKTGFDVVLMRAYRRFFLECVDTLVRSRVDRTEPGEIGAAQRIKIYSLARYAYRIADQLDMLLFWTRGHSLLAVGKRRGWRPREAPILVDGRSISEAVLSKPGI